MGLKVSSSTYFSRINKPISKLGLIGWPMIPRSAIEACNDHGLRPTCSRTHGSINKA